MCICSARVSIEQITVLSCYAAQTQKYTNFAMSHVELCISLTYSCGFRFLSVGVCITSCFI